MSEQGFRDLDHVQGWLQQFSKPNIATSTDEASIQTVLSRNAEPGKTNSVQ